MAIFDTFNSVFGISTIIYISEYKNDFIDLISP
jgi:hypothetical protein